MTAVFLDTVGLIATWDRNDQWHTAASNAYNPLKAKKTPVLTTTYVLAECANATARTPFRTDTDDLRQRLEAAGRLITPTEADWHAAWAAYRRGEAAQAGLVDHISFVVMRRLGLDTAFTNDRHFQAAGFQVLF